jgi:hypothetical protein
VIPRGSEPKHGGDTTRILFCVFIVPIALVVQVFRNRRATG